MNFGFFLGAALTPPEGAPQRRTRAVLGSPGGAACGQALGTPAEPVTGQHQGRQVITPDEGRLFAACCWGRDGGNIASLNTCLGPICPSPNHSLE